MLTPDLVKDALDRIKKRPVDYEYFFNQLQSPKWIEPLWEKGMFVNPPGVVREGQYISFPSWAESRYLARMAKISPELVLKVMLKMKETGNPRVHEDLADAALSMPADLSVQWVKKEIKWLEKQDRLYFLFPEKLANLMVYMANSKKVAVSLSLAKALLRILPDPDFESKQKKKYSSIDPKTLFDVWEYQEILQKQIPSFVKALGMPAFNLLADLLKSYIDLSRSHKEKAEFEDHSYIWRPAIENHEQNRGLRHIEDTLVTAVRDAGDQLAAANGSVIDLVNFLDDPERRWKIFIRIAMYLLKQHDAPIDLLSKHIVNREFFDDLTLRHEYAHLIGKRFNSLSNADKDLVLSWIEKGPDLKQFKRFRKKMSGKESTPEEMLGYRESWQLQRLTWIKESLSDAWRKRYQELVKKHGEPEHPDFFSYTGVGWVGPESPKSAEDLKKMTASEIATYLKEWKAPKDQWRSPSPEGLGRILTDVVAAAPQEFADTASSFEGLHPTYVRSLISGFGGAAEKNIDFNWQAVLKLCEWVMAQPSEASPTLAPMRDADPDWTWTRKAITRLLVVGFKKEEDSIPLSKREEVWRLLEPLTRDADPTPEREKGSMEPTTTSINSTRGEAMHAVIEYGLWLRRDYEKQPDGGTLIEKGFELFPEVRQVLSEHLDVSKDPSLAIRSVYGQWLPWINLLDSKWVKDNLDKIFPKEEKYREYYQAAWEAYIIFCSPYDNIFQILKHQYDRAVDVLISEGKSKRTRPGNPSHHLIHHLMTFYWRGKLSFDDAAMSKFWNETTDELREVAIDYLGRSLYNTKENDIEPAILNRFKYLWQKRVEVARKDPKSHVREIGGFGWWFVSRKFEIQWSLEQLHTALRIARHIEPDHFVADYLAELVHEFPKEVINCLELIVKDERDDWGYYSWRDEARKILEVVLQTEFSKSAENLIHYLGSRGHLDFGELLKK